jgi:hypothetical protein
MDLQWCTLFLQNTRLPRGVSGQCGAMSCLRNVRVEGELPRMGNIHIHGDAAPRDVPDGRQDTGGLMTTASIRVYEEYKHSPHNLVQAQFQSVATFCSHAEIWKYKKAGVFVLMLCVFQMIQG